MASSVDAASIVGGEPVSTKTELQKILEDKTATKVAADVAVADANKLRGMHRELYALIGGRPPLAAATEYTSDKAKLLAKAPAAKWAWEPFKNEARRDNLTLSHWVKLGESPSEYPFAKFNKASRMPVYSRDDYLRYLTDDDWTEQETSLLFELCRRYDLRFIVIHDRYTSACKERSIPSKRSIEDLKERYYNVWTKIAEARNVRQDRIDKAYRYDATHEMNRKEQLLRLSKRTFAQIHEELLLTQELKRIKQYKRDREQGKNATAAAAVARRVSESGDSRKRKLSVSDLKRRDTTERASKIVVNRPPKPSHPYLRSTIVHRVLPLKQKQLLQVASKCKDRGIPEYPIPTSRVDEAYDAVRKVVLEHLQLQSSIDHRKYEISQLGLKKNSGTARKR